MHDAPSKQLIQQRVRNRIFEYLEVVKENPRACGVRDLNELINEWQSWVDHPFLPQNYPPPTFSVEEVTALAIAHEAWLGFADSTPQDIQDEPAARAVPEWKAFVEACAAAVEVFQVRGRLPEDEE